MGRTVVVPAAGQPVSLAEAKVQCEIDDLDADAAVDAQLGIYIAAATGHAESVMRRAVMRQTWRLSLDAFPDEIRLPGGVVESIVSITYVDADGAVQTLDPAAYQLDTSSVPARIHPAYGASWPTTRAHLNAVKVDYLVGWATAAEVPDAIKSAILLMVRDLFDNRSTNITGTIVAKNPTAGFLLFPWKVMEA